MSHQPQHGAISSKDDVQHMFDEITPRYDLMNHVMTGGMDIRWRTMLAKQAANLADRKSESVLDVACGTGDVAFAMRNQGIPSVTGLDFSAAMIERAKEKDAKNKADVTFTQGDAMALPYPDATFDATTISFGLRNLPDYAAGIKEMARVVKPGGKVIVLEMTPFRRPFLRVPFQFYFRHIVPLIGAALTGNYAAYKYLPESVQRFPTADDLADLFRAADLQDVTYTLHGLGAVALHVGVKP